MDMKKTGVVIVCMALAITLGSGVVFAAPVNVSVNGSELTFDQPAIVENGRTLVPLRAIFEELGAPVEWDQSTQIVTATKGDITVTIQIGSNILTRNGEQITLDVPPQIVGGRALVPLRAIAESFGVEVDWDENTRTAIINGQYAGVSFANANSAGLYDERYEFASGDIRTILGIDDYSLGEMHSYDLGRKYNLVHYSQWQIIDLLGQEIQLSHFGITQVGNIFGTQTGDALFVTMISEIGSDSVEESRKLLVDIGCAQHTGAPYPTRTYRAFPLD